jgi:hypothetical protein
MALRGIFEFLRGQTEAERVDGSEQNREPEQNDEIAESAEKRLP